jgi:hypothetical protein
MGIFEARMLLSLMKRATKNMQGLKDHEAIASKIGQYVDSPGSNLSLTGKIHELI